MGETFCSKNNLGAKIFFKKKRERTLFFEKKGVRRLFTAKYEKFIFHFSKKSFLSVKKAYMLGESGVFIIGV